MEYVYICMGPVMPGSGTHGLNEELGKHHSNSGRKDCMLCGDECESVGHVLWLCLACICGSDFVAKLQGDYEERISDRQGKSSFVLGSK